jgi:hypothetical protein
MIHDPIVDEVRAIREQLAARFDFDIRKIVADAQRRQASSAARIVSFEKPNQPLQPTGAAMPVSSETPVVAKVKRAHPGRGPNDPVFSAADRAWLSVVVRHQVNRD